MSNPWTRQYPSHDDLRIGSSHVLIESDRVNGTPLSVRSLSDARRLSAIRGAKRIPQSTRDDQRESEWGRKRGGLERDSIKARNEKRRDLLQ